MLEYGFHNRAFSRITKFYFEVGCGRGGRLGAVCCDAFLIRSLCFSIAASARDGFLCKPDEDRGNDVSDAEAVRDVITTHNENVIRNLWSCFKGG